MCCAFQLTVCPQPTDCQLKSITCTDLLHIYSIPPDDYHKYASWFLLHRYLFRGLVNISLTEYTRVIWWGCPNYPKIQEPLQNSKHQQDGLKQDTKMIGANRQHLVGLSNLVPMVYDITQATLHQFISNFKLHVHFGSHPLPPSPPPPPPTSSSCQSEC
jgi:hypothetical protein